MSKFDNQADKDAAITKQKAVVAKSKSDPDSPSSVAREEKHLAEIEASEVK